MISGATGIKQNEEVDSSMIRYESDNALFIRCIFKTTDFPECVSVDGHLNQSFVAWIAACIHVFLLKKWTIDMNTNLNDMGLRVYAHAFLRSEVDFGM